MSMRWSPGYAPVDEYFDNVSLLLHGDGANGSQTVIDSSPSPKTVTAIGNAQINTTVTDPFGRTGVGVLALDGTGDCLSLDPELSELRLGFSDFTIEAWIRITAIASGAGEFYWPIVIRGAVFNTERNNVQSYALYYSQTNGNRLLLSHRTTAFGFNEGVNLFTKKSSVLNLSFGTWYHVSVTRSSNSIKMFVDGTDVTDSSSGNYDWSTLDFSLTGTNNKFEIGKTRGGVGDNGNVFWDSNGYIDDLRITKGVARYTANFTPPTAPFPDLSPTTRLLLP